MSTGNETINLASLHEDIIRRIIRFDERYDIQLVLKSRLISKSWNTIALDYLSNRRNLPEIELVEIAGTHAWPDFLEPVVRFIEGTVLLVTIPHISMYASGIGMNRWTEIMSKSEKSKIVDTSCFKYPIPLPTGDDQPFYAAIVAAICGFWYWCGGVSLLMVVGTVMLPISMLIGLCYYKFYEREITAASRLIRTFQRFSQIKRLQLCDLEEHTFSIVEKRIGDIIIMNLEANALKFGASAKTTKSIRRTVALCRRHSVRHVCLYLQETVEDTYFRKFVSELMKIGVKLDVFDCQSFDPQPWLGHTQMWWDQLANDLSSLQISLRMITKADPDFSTYYARRGMEAHFQFRKFGDGDILAPSLLFAFSMFFDNNEASVATLPPDIIHRLVRCDNPSTNKMRLISHSWNTVVLEFLSHRHNLPPLERVFFSQGPFRHEGNSDYVKQLRMYALVPEKFIEKERVGAGLIVHDGERKKICGRMNKICRKNAVQKVLISICKFKDDFDFGQFVIDLAEIGVQLDLYDTECRNTPLVFGQGQDCSPQSVADERKRTFDQRESGVSHSGTYPGPDEFSVSFVPAGTKMEN
ncbi:hypothetical protein PRIPAC_93901 [Pristionchus pacificus]|uniref:Uncharacterized protein n=1 Tax=Pristionchus pacificus TaxID=54126 RepID=A0A2A6BPU6_PRIPA|nr:hypothetical protein PRIPAC_93901 [Pristionchus pacificus]|eukprot:PDM67949.1 hypothetical protein PRIPAC_45993 [Pristionchus pacificus]